MGSNELRYKNVNNTFTIKRNFSKKKTLSSRTHAWQASHKQQFIHGFGTFWSIHDEKWVRTKCRSLAAHIPVFSIKNWPLEYALESLDPRYSIDRKGIYTQFNFHHLWQNGRIWIHFNKTNSIFSNHKKIIFRLFSSEMNHAIFAYVVIFMLWMRWLLHYLYF